MAYAFTLWTCYVLKREYEIVASMRLHFLATDQRRPDQLTLLVKNVPLDPDESVSELVEHFFMVNHPDHYLTYQAVYNANKLSELVGKKKKAQHWLDSYQLKYSRRQSERPTTKTGFLGLFGEKVDAIDFYTSKIERLSREVRIRQLERAVLDADDSKQKAYKESVKHHEAAKTAVDTIHWATEAYNKELKCRREIEEALTKKDEELKELRHCNCLCGAV